MDISTFDESFSRVELGALVAAAVIVGVLLGPGAIPVDGADSMWIEAASAVLMAMSTFVVGAISLWASKR